MPPIDPRPSDLSEGQIVEHHSLGVGRITGRAGSDSILLIDFPGYPNFRMSRHDAMESLVPLPEDGLEAQWMLDPESVKAWVKNARLRLVAAAIADLQRPA